MKRLMLFVAVVSAMLLCSSVAQAVQVDVRYVGLNPGLSTELENPIEAGAPMRGLGVYEIEVDLNDDKGPFSVRSFCIDLVQDVSAGWQPYDVTALHLAPVDGGSPYSPMGVPKANSIRELWGEHYAEVGNDPIKAAAFQAALWEIIYENDGVQTPNPWDLTSGRLAVPNSPLVSAQANAWLADVGDQVQTLNTTLLALTNYTTEDRFQDYVYDPDGPGHEVPEPITVVSVMAGVCGLGAYLRKRTAAA